MMHNTAKVTHIAAPVTANVVFYIFFPLSRIFIEKIRERKGEKGNSENFKKSTAVKRGMNLLMFKWKLLIMYSPMI